MHLPAINTPLRTTRRRPSLSGIFMHGTPDNNMETTVHHVRLNHFASQTIIDPFIDCFTSQTTITDTKWNSPSIHNPSGWEQTHRGPMMDVLPPRGHKIWPQLRRIPEIHQSFEWHFQVKQQQQMELITAPRRDPFITRLNPPAGSSVPKWNSSDSHASFPERLRNGSETRPIQTDVRGSGWRGVRGGPALGRFQPGSWTQNDAGLPVTAGIRHKPVRFCLRVCIVAIERLKSTRSARLRSIYRTNAAVSTYAGLKNTL